MAEPRPLSLLLVDNYDSFTFTLQHLLEEEPGVSLTVRRNDEDFLPEIAAGRYDGAVIGPGPGSPEDEAYFGHNRRLILEYGPKGLPLLGVCLGLQGIYHCFGGTLKVAALPMHGKISALRIDRAGVLLAGVPQGAPVMRYHSILADLDKPVPEGLELTAFTSESPSEDENGPELMALEHRDYPVYGIQFHPESFATVHGRTIARNFIRRCRA